MTPLEYSNTVEDLARRVEHDLPYAFARACNAGPGRGRWNDYARELRKVADLAETLEGSVTS